MLTPEDFKTQPEPVVQEPAVEAEAAAPAQPPVEEAPVEQPVAAGPTPEEIALGVKDEQGQYQPTDNTAEKQTRESGLITQITEGIGYALTGGLTQDVLDKSADAINYLSGGNAQGLADFVMSADEMEARKVADAKEAAEKRAAGEMGGVEAALDTTLNAVTGISSGTEAGLALPATIAARLANQATPWADPPEQIKQSPVGSTLFEVAQVVVPTLLSGGVAAAYGKGAIATSTLGLAGESFAETATQDSAEDLIAGRSLAGKYGELADYLGFDGSQLTKDLIEGTTPQAQTINALTGFVQNFGINVGTNSLVNQVTKKLRPGAKAVDNTVKPPEELGEPGTIYEYDGGTYVTRSAPTSKGDWYDAVDIPEGATAEEITEITARAQDQARSYQSNDLADNFTPDAQTQRTAEILGKKPEDIERSINDVTNPAYSPDREITDAMDVDSQVPVSRPTGDNEVISEAALVRESTRTVSGVDGLTTSQRNYFTNINNVMRGGRKRQLLQETLNGLQNLRGQDAELQEIAARSAKWLSDNGELSMDEMREALKDLAIKPLDTSPEGLVKFQNSDTTAILREIGAASDEGMMILPILLEESTVRLQKAATIAANVDQLMDVPFDATKAFEDFLQLQDFVEDLSIPLRRAKRQWSTSGKAQQRTYRRFMEKMIDDIDVSDVKASSASDKFIGYGETQTPMRQLYEAWQAGDEAAGQTFKEYLGILKGLPTEQLGAGVKNMDTVLRKALNQGNKDAVQQLFFAAMLSRPGTQLAAFGGGTLEAIIQPLGKMAQGVPLISSPGGAITNPKARASFFQGVGEFYGGMKSISDGLSEWRRSYQSGKSLTSSSKIDSGIENVVKKRLELKNTYAALQEQLTRDGASEMQKFNLAMVYQLNNAALHPVTQIPMRSLTATDSGLGLVIGNQKAYGRAFANWSQNGGKLDELIPQEMDKIWSDGVKYGSFKDTEVVMGVRELMLQNDIPTNRAGGLIENSVDSVFAGLEGFAKDSWFARLFNPFVRLSYQSLETAARYSLLSIPGVTEALPKYKKILAGEMGQVAQQQLESQIAFGRLSSMSIAGIAYQGGATGHNPPNGLPRTSFIIPAPWTEKGYLAVPYGKLQPFATHIALISDATTGLRDKVINQGEYDRYVGEMIMSLGISAFDSNFLMGMQNMVEVISSKTWTSEEKLSTALADAASVLSPRIIALAGNIQNPYKEFLDDKTNPALGFGNKLRDRMLGGANDGSTTQYNIYDGKKIPRVATLDGANDNYWAAAAGVAFAEVAWTGKVQNAEVSDRQKKMSSVGYEVQRQWYTTAKIDGAQVNLTPVEQSKLSEYLGKQGRLANNVDNYLRSKSFKEDYSKFIDQSQQDNGELPRKPINKAASLLGQTTVNAASEGYQERMKSKLAQIHEEAKAQAAIALFKGDPNFDQRLQIARLSNPDI